jgi:penicillin-insensitive murein endopeptidase
MMRRTFMLFALSFGLATGLPGHADMPARAQTPAIGPATPAAPSEPDAAVTAPIPQTPAPAIATPAETTPAPLVETPPLPPEKPGAKTKAIARQVLQAARDLFVKKELPSLGKAMAIGYYPRGCLQGGVELPTDGEHWQVMRLSRNRNWGHPSLVRYVKNFSARAAKATGWHGILVGDLAQPRGGPTPYGHRSHQTGLDVDIWFVPMPKETLTPEQREKMSANNLVADDWKRVNPAVYTPQHAAFIKAATEAPEVERVLVNAAIKKKLCETASGDRKWLEKVRPWYGHHDHIHVRLRCPPGESDCKGQPPTPGSEGCGDADLKFWFTKALVPVKPSTKPGRPLTLADLPPACKNVLEAPASAQR